MIIKGGKMKILLINSSSVIIVVLGILFILSRNSSINRIFGFYSSLSCKNKETWKFGNLLFGQLCIISGLVCFCLSLFLYAFMSSDWRRIALIVFFTNFFIYFCNTQYVNYRLYKNFNG